MTPCLTAIAPRLNLSKLYIFEENLSVPDYQSDVQQQIISYIRQKTGTSRNNPNSEKRIIRKTEDGSKPFLPSLPLGSVGTPFSAMLVTLRGETASISERNSYMAVVLNLKISVQRHEMMFWSHHIHDRSHTSARYIGQRQQQQWRIIYFGAMKAKYW